MNIDKSSDVIKVLWSPYLSLIKKGLPLYFNFTEDLLINLFLQNKIDCENPLMLINNLVEKYFVVDGNNVVLLDSALTPLCGDFSPAILFVCQQVLVVETMINDTEFTSNAYFPHLRTSMSKQLAIMSESPFDYEDFEAIWSRLSREVILAGGRQECLTFSFGKIAGRDQARRFPLSQALLSKEDIVRLIDAIGRHKVSSMNSSACLEFMRNNKNRLSKRGRGLIALPWMQDRIVAQLCSFARSDETFRLIKEEIREDSVLCQNFEIKIYEEINWFSPSEFSIGVFNKETTELVESSDITLSVLRNAIFVPRFVVFHKSEKGDSWTNSGKYELKTDLQLMIVYSHVSADELHNYLNYYFDFTYIGQGQKFPRQSSLSFLFFSISRIKKSNIFLNEGKIVESNVKISSPFRFLDGLSLDKNSHWFHHMHLPQNIVINDIQHSLENKRIRVNSVITLYSDFISSLKSLKKNEIYSIELEDPSIKFSLKVIGAEGALLKDLIGFPLNIQKIDPVAQYVSLNDPALIGFDFSREIIQSTFERYELGDLIRRERQAR